MHTTSKTCRVTLTHKANLHIQRYRPYRKESQQTDEIHHNGFFFPSSVNTPWKQSINRNRFYSWTWTAGFVLRTFWFQKRLRNWKNENHVIWRNLTNFGRTLTFRRFEIFLSPRDSSLKTLTHTYRHTHRHTHTRAYTHTHAQMRTRRRTHRDLHAHRHSCTQTYTHIHTQTILTVCISCLATLWILFIRSVLLVFFVFLSVFSSKIAKNPADPFWEHASQNLERFFHCLCSVYFSENS